jgi:outer membrane protein assembly factor BamC
LNRIYISHRGTEYNYVLTTDGPHDDERSDSVWTFRQPEPELEIQMLSRLMIYLGLHEEEVARQGANVKLFKPRAVMDVDIDEGSPFLIIFDPYQIAWNRVFHQLGRMNFKIVGFDFKSELSEEGVIFIEADTLEMIEETGLFSLQTEAKEGTIKFTLVFEEETNQSTRMILENEKGEYDTSPAGTEFIKLLYQRIK